MDKNGMERREESDGQTDRITFCTASKNATQAGMPHGSPTQCYKGVSVLTVCRKPGFVP